MSISRDTNLSGRVVRVRGKGGKERLVPFNRSAADAIRAMMADRLQGRGQGQRAQEKEKGEGYEAWPGTEARGRAGREW